MEHLACVRAFVSMLCFAVAMLTQTKAVFYLHVRPYISQCKVDDICVYMWSGADVKAVDDEVSGCLCMSSERNVRCQMESGHVFFGGMCWICDVAVRCSSRV